MNDAGMVILAVVGFLLTWTVTVVSLVVWLTGKFRDLEKIIYHEMDKHRTDDDRQFRTLGTEVMRLKIKVFGFTGPVSEANGIAL